MPRQLRRIVTVLAFLLYPTTHFTQVGTTNEAYSQGRRWLAQSDGAVSIQQALLSSFSLCLSLSLSLVLCHVSGPIRDTARKSFHPVNPLQIFFSPSHKPRAGCNASEKTAVQNTL